MAGHRHSHEEQLSDQDHSVGLWLARIGLNVDLFARSTESRGEVLDLILGSFKIKSITSRSPRSAIRAALKARALRLKRKADAKNSSLLRNVAMLSELLGLDRLQQEILAFAISVKEDAALREVANFLVLRGRREFLRGMGAIFGCSEKELKLALAFDAPLIGSGLIWIEKDFEDVAAQVNVMEGLASRLVEECESAEGLIRGFLEPAPPSTLTAADFSHLEDDIQVLLGYLRSAVAKKTVGVNILLYGLPGTGKTELARLLAARLGVSMHQVRFVNDAREPLGAKDRLASYQLCQRFLARGANSVVVFDEIEDVFPQDAEVLGFRLRQGSGFGKAWINSLLESNPVPTLWISNDIGQIDRAYLRRFDFSVEFRRLPRSARTRIVHMHLGNIPGTETVLARLADHEALLPSQVAKAAKMLTVGEGSEIKTDAVVARAVENSMKLLGQRAIYLHSLDSERCAVEYFNANVDIAALISSFKAKYCRGSLCFFGPPGTGKTALARLLAAELDRPLLAKRGSDLISPFLGGTERQIADMFDQAREDRALLLLDEADSFLLDRREAVRSWEITQVNEMLTQMEQFEGLFICSTNLVNRLDEASLRRFDIKIKFDYLTLPQRLRLFCETLGIAPDTLKRGWQEKLQRLSCLTPGDFAVVKRRAALLEQRLEPALLLKLLYDECSMKSASTAGSIGFVSEPGARTRAHRHVSRYLLV